MCLIFGVYHLSLLADDYYLTNYLIVENEDSLYDNFTFFFFCSTFDEIKENNRLQIPKKPRKVPVKTFLNYSISSIEDRLRLKGQKLLDLNRSFTHHKRICFIISKQELESSKPFFEKYLEHYNLELFVSSRFVCDQLCVMTNCIVIQLLEWF